MYNFCKHTKQACRNIDVHVLISEIPMEKVEDAKAAFEGWATLHTYPTIRARPDELSQLFSAKRQNRWDFSEHYEKSLNTLLGLSQLQAELGRNLDIIEFPDFGGYGAASIAAKQAGLMFENSLLAVRLHSTFGLISRYEKYYHHPSAYIGHVSDLERYALKYADLIIGHVPAIGHRNREHYGFDEKWLNNVHYEFPLIEHGKVDVEDHFCLAEADFLFSSRLQPFKRSDLFVRAAVRFLEERPRYQGIFRLLCSGWDQDYVAHVKGLVPSQWAHKIIFIDKVEQSRRDSIINKSIVVIPSDYESLCLFAYEAASAGARVILNRSCEAFGSFDRWVEGENCLMFDGTSLDLTTTMRQALDWRPTSSINMTADVPYWCKDEIAARGSVQPANSKTALRVSVVHYGYDSIEDVSQAMMEMQHRPIEAHRVVFALQQSLVSAVEEVTRKANFEIIALSGSVISAEELGRKLLGFDDDLMLLCPKGYAPHQSFLQRAQIAFERNPDLMVFSTHVRCIHPASGDVYDLQVFGGEMPSSALQENIISSRLAVVRRVALEDYPFDDRARGFWFEVWLRQLVLKGEKVIVAPIAAVDFVTLDPVIHNSQRVSGTIIDDEGLRHGQSSRLIALDARGGGDHHWPQQKVEIHGESFIPARLLHPGQIVRDFELVRYRPDLGGLLVHPVNGEIVVVELGLTDGAMRHLRANFWLSNSQSEGVEVSVALSYRKIESGELKAVLSGSMRLEGMSEWLRLSGGQYGELHVANAFPTASSNRALIFCRVPRGGTEDFGHLVLQRLTVDID